MAIPITVPRLGWNMEEGVFVGWLKPDGAPVSAGQSLFTLENEKATQDIECLEAGILRIAADAPRAGDRVVVGAIIGHLTQVGEALPAPRDNMPSVSTPSAGQATSAAAPMHTRGGKSPVPASSPRARRLAVELGLDWTTLRGSGRTGRIRESDVRAAARNVAVPSQGSSIRGTIAQRLVAGHQGTAPVTLTTTADATNLVNLRTQFKAARQAASDLVPGYTDLLVKLTAAALQKHPLLNAYWQDGQVRLNSDIHIGVAVDTDAGLLVPVLRDVPSLGLKHVAERLRDLVERARQRKLKPEEMQGGTFTLTNLGALGIDAFTPLINLPQCAILGIGRIQSRPVVLEDKIVARDQITLSLTFDHRIVDGAPAGRFLQTLSLSIENPGPCLIG